MNRKGKEEEEEEEKDLKRQKKKMKNRREGREKRRIWRERVNRNLHYHSHTDMHQCNDL